MVEATAVQRHRLTGARVRRVLASPVTLVSLGAFLIYATYSISRYAQYLASGYDLGIFDQAVRAYSRFQVPLVALKGENYNILGDHFHPIIAVLAPLYWIWNDPRTLLIAQAALIAASCIPVWRFMRRRFASRPATLLLIMYALGWPMQGLIDFDFHEIAFAVPLIAWAIDALDRRSDRELLVTAGLLLLVREDLGAVVFIIGLLRLVRRPRWRGALIALGGLVALVVVLKVVVPGIGGGSYAYWNYTSLGAGPENMIHTVMTDPGKVITLFFTPFEKTQTLIALLAPLLFLPLFSRLSLLALPILLERFLADRSTLWTSEFHYNAPLWPIFFLGAVSVLAWLIARVPAERKRRVLIAAVAVIVAIPVTVVPLAGTFFDTYPFARMATGGAFAWTPQMADQAAAVASIPANTCISADDRLASHLTATNRVTVPGIPAPKIDFYLLDLSQPMPATTPANWTTAQALSIATDAGFTEVNRFGAITVMRSATYDGPSAGCHS